MKIDRPIYYALGTAAILGIARYVYKMKELSDSITTRVLKISSNKGTNLLFLSITFDLEIINPTDKHLKVEGISGEISLEGRTVARFKTKKHFVLVPGVTGVSFSAVVDNVGLVENILAMAFTRKLPPVVVDYSLKTIFPFVSVAQQFSFNAKDFQK